MLKGNSLRKTGVTENPADEDGSQSSEKSYWVAGEEENALHPDESESERAGRQEDHSELYRAGKIDAYLHYLKMRPQVRDNEPVTLRRSVPPRERPQYRTFDDEEEREDRLYGYQPRSLRRPSPRAPRLSSRQPRRNLARDIAVAASLSLAVGGLTGLIVYDRTSGGTVAQTVMTKVSALWSAAPVTAPPPEAMQPPATTTALADADQGPVTAVPQSVVSKKPVAIAELDVEDASGMASSLIPLSLRADPGIPGQALALRLSGLPENSSLTAGTRVSETAWMLRPGEEKGIKLVVPSNVSGQFAIAVEALEPRTGDLAAPIKEITVSILPAIAATIVPAAAPASITRNFNLPETKPEPAGLKVAEPRTAEPKMAESKTAAPEAALPKVVEPQVAAAIPAGPPKPDSAMPIPAPIEKTSIVQSGAAHDFVRSGDKLMSLGDLTAARQFYAKALDQGVPEAALKLGQTYDPTVFADKNVQGLKPDPAMAMKYYLQAQASGVADAQPAISGLEAWMQR